MLLAVDLFLLVFCLGDRDLIAHRLDISSVIEQPHVDVCGKSERLEAFADGVRERLLSRFPVGDDLALL